MAKAGPRKIGAAGFVALQSLIGAAIVAGISAVLMGIVGNLSDLSGSYIMKEESTSAYLAAQSVLMQEGTCQNALLNSTNGPIAYDDSTRAANVQRIVAINSTNNRPEDVLVSGGRFRDKISIGQMTLGPLGGVAAPGENELVWDSPTVSNTFRTYIALLTIPSFKGTVQNQNTALPPQTIALKLFVRNGAVERCFSLASDNQTCVSFGGRMLSGRCVLDPCGDDDTDPYNALTAPAKLGTHLPCPRPDPRKLNCGTPRWFWIFRGATTSPGPPATTEPSRPKCICLQSCA